MPLPSLCVTPTSDVGSFLTRSELIELSEQARELAEESGEPCYINLCGYALADLNLTGHTWQRVIFGRTGHPPARLRNVKLNGANMTWCEFVGVVLDGVDMGNSRVADCDFRYSRIKNSNLNDATVITSDFYGASFERGTNLARVILDRISPPDTFEGAAGLRWDSFGVERAFVSEDGSFYEQFLQRSEHERPDSRPLADAKRERLENAARAYRVLSGYWESRGQYDDASRAYVRSQRLLRHSMGPWFRDTSFQPRRWLALWLADLVCGFGESLGRVALALLVVTCGPGLVYSVAGGVEGATGFLDCLIFSVSRATTVAPTGLAADTRLVDWISVSQSITAIALLGLFGFVLGNVIRRA